VNETAKVHHYFVDEAGDLTLFDKHGRDIVGSEGVSHLFMVGVAHVPDPDQAHQRLEQLRAELLADPYFKNVPSMQPQEMKTVHCFHAKDDLPEVRREVFRLLPQLGVKVQVAIRRKSSLASAARMLFQRGQKLRANDVYDDLVKRLFKNLLHKADENRIVFARRGKSARAEALQEAIAHAKANFQKKWEIKSDRPTSIHAAYPSESAGLQVIDYYLWALQRLYGRSEDRFFQLLAGDFKLVMDLDDQRNQRYGEWYSAANPLSPDKIKPVTS